MLAVSHSQHEDLGCINLTRGKDWQTWQVSVFKMDTKTVRGLCTCDCGEACKTTKGFLEKLISGEESHGIHDLLGTTTNLTHRSIREIQSQATFAHLISSLIWLTEEYVFTKL